MKNNRLDSNQMNDEIAIDIQLSDIFNIVDLQKMQDLFSDAMGVASIITHPDGRPITKPSNFTRLCSDIIRKTDKGCANCFKSDAIIGTRDPLGPKVQPCLSGGLWDAGASITVGGNHIANWLVGQVKNDELDLDRMVRYADEIGTDRNEFMEALAEVPVMSIGQFTKVAKMLFAFANEISEKAYNNLLFKRQIEEKDKITEALRESEENLFITLHSIGDGVIATDDIGRIVRMNPVAETLCGWKLEDAKGKYLPEVFKIISSLTGQPAEDPAKRVLEDGQVVGLANHTVLISKDGTEYQIADSASPIKDKSGNVKGVVLVFSDVTEKYNAQLLIDKSREKFFSLYMNMAEGAVLHELIYNESGNPFDYVILETNKAFETQLGIQKENVIGKASREAYQTSEPPFLELYASVAQSGEPITFETYFPPLDKHFSISVYSPYKGSFATVFQDITDRKYAEAALNQTTDALAFLAQYSSSDRSGDFFNLLAQYLANALKADFVCIDSLEGDGLNARTVSVWCDGKFEDNVVYALKDTPCGVVIGKTVCCFPANVCQFFPRDAVLQDLKAESYVGTTLWGHSGNAIGLIAVIKRNKLENQKQAEDLLKIVAVRAGGEMERIAAEEEIKYQNEELHKHIATKDKFFSIIAHDLRSPFNGFLGLTQIMVEELPSLTMAEIQEIATGLRDSAVNLFRLLENLLSWSRMQQGLIAFNPHDVQLLPIVEESSGILNESAKHKNIDLTFDIPNDLSIFADTNLLQTVMRNLVSNAIKFTTNGGSVLVSAKAIEHGGVEISIKDSGIGISTTMVGDLFRLDSKAGRKGTAGEPSTGLGLMLCKEFVGMHGGNICVKSEEGKGSVFSFTIPTGCAQ